MKALFILLILLPTTFFTQEGVVCIESTYVGRNYLYIQNSSDSFGYELCIDSVVLNLDQINFVLF